jgi:CBS domain containing-hemolysin-like protein
MSEMAIQLSAVFVAGFTALWAALFAMGREARSIPSALGDPPGSGGDGVPLGQAMQQCHLALLILSGAAVSQAVVWWQYPLLVSLGRIVVSLGLLYFIASGIPRSLGALLPNLAGWAAVVSRDSLVLFRPLVGLAALMEARMHAKLPAPERATDRYGPEHAEMLDGVFSLSRTTVEEAMTPRLDVEALSAAASWGEVVGQLRRSDHARLPVYNDDLDKINGIIYAKDLTPAISGLAQVPENWLEFVRPAPFVPESKTLTAQLRDFQRGPSGLAIVVDEFGGTSGIITLEDVLEEVVGEIHGEYDVDVTPPVEREGEDRFWVDGSVPLDDLSELLGVELESEEVTTVGGLVYAELGQVPQPGEQLRIAGFRVVVEQVERRRIKRVYFERVSGFATPEDIAGVDE